MDDCRLMSSNQVPKDRLSLVCGDVEQSNRCTGTRVLRLMENVVYADDFTPNGNKSPRKCCFACT